MNRNSELSETDRIIESSLSSQKQHVHQGALISEHRKIRLENIVYLLALAISVAIWFSAIGSPLWLDEALSYWKISRGFSRIFVRTDISLPTYYVILWVTKTLFGSSEIVLRIPSVLAMLAATYVLYRSAREFFAQDVALIATIFFCLHPIVAFAAIDARPYAFGILTVNCAFLCLLLWMRTHALKYAIGFGIAAASIFYFHYLLSVVLLAFALIFAAVKGREWKSFARQTAAAFVAFTLMMLPVVPRLLLLFQTGQSHVFSDSPHIEDLIATFDMGKLLVLFGITALLAAACRKAAVPENEPEMTGWVCLLMAFIPIGILYGVSVLTPIHVFVERWRLEAIPGIALCWGLLISRINSKAIRVIFCVAMVASTVAGVTWSIYTPHGYTWKYAIEAANASTANDHAPLLICSDVPESNVSKTPGEVSSSGVLAQLSYYRVISPVLPLPRALNQETMSKVHKFLATAVPARRRFLVVGFLPSWSTIRWIKIVTKDLYTPKTVGVYDGVTVVEFIPR